MTLRSKGAKRRLQVQGVRANARRDFERAFAGFSKDPRVDWHPWQTLWCERQFNPLPTKWGYCRLIVASVFETAAVFMFDFAWLPFATAAIKDIDPGNTASLCVATLIMLVTLALQIALLVALLRMPLEALVAVALLLSPEAPSDAALCVVLALVGKAWWTLSRDKRERFAKWLRFHLRISMTVLRHLRQRNLHALCRLLFRRPEGKPVQLPDSRAGWPVLRGMLLTCFWLGGFPLAAVLALNDFSLFLSHTVSQVHAVDEIYMQVLIECLGSAVAIALIEFLLGRPARKLAIDVGKYDDPEWVSFRSRRELNVEACWALVTAAVAFLPAALASSWLPFVGLTAVTAALIIPRIRRWVSDSITRQADESSAER